MALGSQFHGGIEVGISPKRADDLVESVRQQTNRGSRLLAQPREFSVKEFQTCFNRFIRGGSGPFLEVSTRPCSILFSQEDSISDTSSVT